MTAEHQPSAAARDGASSVAHIADGFVSAYFQNDRTWDLWLADLRAACRRMDEEESREVSPANRSWHDSPFGGVEVGYDKP